MKTDLDYLAKILNAFEEADTAFIELSSFPDRGVDLEYNDNFSEEFLFHIHIMIDNGLIGTRKGVAAVIKDIGIYTSLKGDNSFVNIPLRLTQTGHDFACSLSNKEVFATLKAELKGAPFKVLFEGGQRLLEHYLQKKLDSIIG